MAVKVISLDRRVGRKPSQSRVLSWMITLSACQQLLHKTNQHLKQLETEIRAYGPRKVPEEE